MLAGVVTVGLASRYLGLEGFGALTLAMSIVAFVALLTDLGLSTMAAREIARQPEREREILGNVLALGLGAAVPRRCSGSSPSRSWRTPGIPRFGRRC